MENIFVAYKPLFVVIMKSILYVELLFDDTHDVKFGLTKEK